MSETTKPTTVEEYLAALDPDRREVLAAVRRVVLDNLPPGYVEALVWGMPSCVVPLERHPGTRDGRPLGYVSLAAQKRHFAVYLMGLHAGSEDEAAFRAAWTATGRKLDMGKSCLRFRGLDDLDLDLLAGAVASQPVERFLAAHAQGGAG